MGEFLEKLAQIKKQGALEEFLNRLTPEEKQRLNQKIDEELVQEIKVKKEQKSHPILNKIKELGTSTYTGALEEAIDINKLLAGLIPFQRPKNWFLQTFVNPYEQQIQQERKAHPGMLNELARSMGSMGITTPLDIMTGGATKETLLARKFAPKVAQMLAKLPKFALGMGLRKGVEGYQQAQPGVGSKLGGALTGTAQGLGEGLVYHKAGELPLKFRLPTMGVAGAGFGAMAEMEQGRVPSLETAKYGAIQGIAQDVILSLLGKIGGRARNRADKNAHIRVEKIVKEYLENPEKAMPKLEKTLRAIESSKSVSEDYKTAIKQSNLPAIITGKYPVKVETPKVIKVKTIKEEGAIPGAEGKLEVEGKPEQIQVEGKPEASAIIDETVNKKALPPAPIPASGEVKTTTKPIPMTGKMELYEKPISLGGEIKKTETIHGKARENISESNKKHLGKVSKIKQPWEMTKEEWGKLIIKQSNYAKKLDEIKSKIERGYITIKAKKGTSLEEIKRLKQQKIKELQNEYDRIIEKIKEFNRQYKNILKEGTLNHKFWVEKALKEGKEVPSEVIAGYPDLITKKHTEFIYGKERKVTRMPDGSFALANDEDARQLGYNGFLKRKDWNKLEKYKEKIDKAYNHLVKKLDIKPPKWLEDEVKKTAISHSLSDNSEFKGKPLQALKFAFDREYKNFLEGKAKRVEQLKKFAKIQLLKKQLEDNLKKGEKVNPEDLKEFPSLADKYNYDYKTGLPKESTKKTHKMTQKENLPLPENVEIPKKELYQKTRAEIASLGERTKGMYEAEKEFAEILNKTITDERTRNTFTNKMPVRKYLDYLTKTLKAKDLRKKNIWKGVFKDDKIGEKLTEIVKKYKKYKDMEGAGGNLEEHEEAIKRALFTGKKVPKEVLRDYPDLIRDEQKQTIKKEIKSKEEELKPTRDLKDILEDKLKKGEDVPGELLENYPDLIKKYNIKIKKNIEDENFESFNEWAKRKGIEVPKIDSNWEFYFANPENIQPEKIKDYKEYKRKVEEKKKLIKQYYKERRQKSEKPEFYDGQPIASDKDGTFVIKKKDGKLSIYYQMKSQDMPDSLAVGFHENIKDAIKRLRQILPNVFKGEEYSYVNPEVKKALKEIEAEEKIKEEKKKQEETAKKEKEKILRKKINKVKNFWHDLDKVKLKFKKHTVELDSGAKVDGWERGQWFVYKIKSSYSGGSEYGILHLPSMKSLPEQPTLADAKRVVKLIEMAGLDKKKNFNNLDLEILKDINRISKLNEKSIDSFEAIKNMLLKKDKMRQTFNYFLDSHIPSFKRKTFISKDGEKRSGMAYKDWVIEKAQLDDGTVFYRIFHLPSGFMIETCDTLKDAKRTVAVYDLMGLDKFKIKDRKDVTKEITDMYRDAGRLAALSEKADIRGELEEFDKKYHILEKMGVTTKLYVGIPIHEVFKAFKDLKKEASEKYHEMTGIDKVIDKDLKLWEKVFKTPQWLAKKYKSIKKILDLEDLKTYTKITKYSDYLRKLENGDELLLSKMNKKEEQAFSDILIALDKYNNSIVEAEKKHGIYEYGKISPFAREIIDSILDQHNLSQKERDRVWRLYQNWFNIAHEIRQELIETLKQTKDKDLIDKYMKDVGYVKYYFPRLRESGNTAIRVYDKDGNLVHLEFTDTLLKGKSPKAHLKALREIRKLYPKEDGYRIRISKNVKGEELDHFNEFLNVAMVKDILESITDKDNEELKKIYAQKLADLFKSRGFLSHAIKRREDYITGFEDERVADVIKKFLAGYSGFAGKKKFVEKLIEEKPKIDRANINERKAVNQMIKHLLRNENTADRISARIKSLLFLKYIAGKVSTPVLNLTQTAITTAPTLAKEIGSLPKAYKIVAKNTGKALRLTIDILKNKPHIFFTSDKKPSYLTREEWETIRKAYEHGDLSSKLAQDFRGKIEGAFRGKLADILIDKPAMLMDVTETYNRILALLSGYEGLKDINKARELMKKTQFDYSKANVPIAFMGEGNTGAMLRSFYTFRRYGHNLLQLWAELAKEDKKAFLASLSTVASIGGITALPLVDWIFNELAKKTGKDYKKEIENYLSDAIGSKLTDIFMRGLPTLIGIDMSGQAGIDIPFFSSYNNSKNLLTYLLKEISGAAGQLALDAQRAVDYIMRGQYKKALELTTPAYVSYPLKAQRLASEGVTKADNSPILVREGKTIKPLKLTKKEAIMKATGFQPLRLNKVYEARGSIKNIEEYFKNKKQNIYNKLRAYAYLKKGDRKELMRQIVNYNKELYKKSPELYRSMRITRRSIKQAIRLNLKPEDKILLMKEVK